jgi:DNA-binding beta-propeller fold protein YncE
VSGRADKPSGLPDKRNGTTPAWLGASAEDLTHLEDCVLALRALGTARVEAIRCARLAFEKLRQEGKPIATEPLIKLGARGGPAPRWFSGSARIHRETQSKEFLMRVPRRLPSTFSSVLLVLAAAACGTRAVPRPALAHAGVSSGSRAAVYELGVDESEVVDVVRAGDGWRAFVVAPAASCEAPGERSFLSVLEFHPARSTVPREAAVIDLGPGEATSVAAGPEGRFAIAARKHPERPGSDRGNLLVIRDGAVVRTLETGPGPDSVAISLDGDLAVIACEAEGPDPDDCPEEEGRPDLPGSIQVFALRGDVVSWRLALEIGGDVIAARINAARGDPAVDPRDIEPEFVAISPDGKTALVTLQETSAVAVVDLDAARGENPTPAAADRALAGVVLLPQDHVDAKGRQRGSHPDGVAFSPDGSLAITANEAHGKTRHLQGISILDLRGGPRAVRVAGTYAIFELDPTLQVAERARPVALKPRRKPLKKPEKLPKLDPEGVAIARLGERTVAAIAIERTAPREEAGSVLLLDITGALSGRTPAKIGRHAVGAHAGARPETLDFTDDGRWLFVASERDGGTVTLFDLAAFAAPAAESAGAASRDTRP